MYIAIAANIATTMCQYIEVGPVYAHSLVYTHMYSYDLCVSPPGPTARRVPHCNIVAKKIQWGSFILYLDHAFGMSLSILIAGVIYFAATQGLVSQILVSFTTTWLKTWFKMCFVPND